jgi:hypothetical protein
MIFINKMMVNKGWVFRQSDAPPAAAVRGLLVLIFAYHYHLQVC